MQTSVQIAGNAVKSLEVLNIISFIENPQNWCIQKPAKHI